jgi:hypothetical protein
MPNDVSVSDHFVNKDPAVRKLYDHLLKILNGFGPVTEAPKKTSIHIDRRSALIGVETRKDSLLLTIKADRKINSPRIEKQEQISSRRFYHKVRVKSPRDFDSELKAWLKDAFTLAE